MSEMAPHSEPQPEAILTGSEFVHWFNLMSVELDHEAADLMDQKFTNPVIEKDPMYQERLSRLGAQKDLLRRVGEDFKEHADKNSVDRLLGDIFTDDTEA